MPNRLKYENWVKAPFINKPAWSAEDQTRDRIGQNIWIACGHYQEDHEAIQMSPLINGPWVSQTTQFNISYIFDWTKIKLYSDVDYNTSRKFLNGTYDMRTYTNTANWTVTGITYKLLGLTLAFFPREDKDDVFFIFENASQAIQHKNAHCWKILGHT